jgi:hypothetical protein
LLAEAGTVGPPSRRANCGGSKQKPCRRQEIINKKIAENQKVIAFFLIA